jgi:hypothetical protein
VVTVPVKVGTAPVPEVPEPVVGVLGAVVAAVPEAIVVERIVVG